jgi:hypothetical protein
VRAGLAASGAPNGIAEYPDTLDFRLDGISRLQESTVLKAITAVVPVKSRSPQRNSMPSLT